MNTGHSRPMGDYGQPGGGPHIVRVRGVLISDPSPVLHNRRLKWDGSDYTPSTDDIEFYEPDATTPKVLSEGEEAWVIWRPSPGRYEELSTAGGNIIIATVNEPSGVTGGDSTFSFDNASAVVGSGPPDGTGTAQNQYAQTYSDNDLVILFQEKSSSAWVTERGGSAGSIIIRFELTEDKSYGDVEATAEPVGGGTQFRVVDEQGQFYGLTGFIGYAQFFTNDYDSTGEFGYNIIAMEGPAYLVAVQPAATFSESGTSCNLVDQQIFNRPHRNVAPDSPPITVHDDFAVSPTPQVGETWVAVWNETQERYTFGWKFGGGGATSGTLAYGMVVKELPAITMSTAGGTYTASATPVDDAVIIMLPDADFLNFSPEMIQDGDEMEMIPKKATGLALSMTAFVASESTPAMVLGNLTRKVNEEKPDGFEYFFTVASDKDFRSLPGFDADLVQIPFHQDGNEDFELGGSQCSGS